MTARLTRGLALTLLVATAQACRVTEVRRVAATAMPVTATTLTVGGAAHRYALARDEADTLGVYRPTDVRTQGTDVVVVENGNDRLTVFDSTLMPRRTIASAGFGPGELQGPMTLDVRGDTIVVSELTNRRLSTFDASGAFRHMVRSASAGREFALLSDGSVLAAIRDRDYYLVRIGADGVQTPFGARAREYLPDLAPEERVLSKGGMELVAVTRGDTVHVLDNDAGILVKYAPDGRRVLVRSLPATLLAEVRRIRLAKLRGFADRKIRIESAPLIKDMTVMSDGRLLVLMNASSAFGIVVDPASYDATPIVGPPDSLAAREVRSAVAGVVHDGRLIVIGQRVIASYPLEAARE